MNTQATNLRALIGPACILVIDAALTYVGLQLVAPLGLLLFASFVVFVLSAAWWTLAASAPGTRPWPNLLLVWLPAVAVVVWLVAAARLAQDVAVVLPMVLTLPTAAAVALALVGSWRLLRRPRPPVTGAA